MLAALAAGCATPRDAAPPPPGAFYWQVAGPDGARFALLGSVHIGDGRELRLDPRVAGDWAVAEELVVEVDTRSLPELETLEVIQRHGLFPPGESLRTALAPATFQQVSSYLKARGYPLEAAERMRPWMLAQLVAQLEYEGAGYAPENGVDAYFLRRAEGQKSIDELETLDEQMAVFASLPAPLQETLLREILRESDSFLETTHQILRAWEEGDEARLLALLLAGSHDPQLAEFHRRVFTDRNHRMTERLDALVRDGRPRFVVVGTGHLIGEESVPELLEERGFRLTRLRDAFVRALPPELYLPETIPAPAPAPAPQTAPAPGSAASP